MATYRYFRAFTPAPDEHVQKHFRRRLDDFLGILEQHLTTHAFAIGARPTVADISMMAYLHYPADETGYDLAISHPAIAAWLGRMAALPGWKSAYDLLPGKRLTHYIGILEEVIWPCPLDPAFSGSSLYLWYSPSQASGFLGATRRSLSGWKYARLIFP